MTDGRLQLLLSVEIVGELASLAEKPDVVRLLARRKIGLSDFVQGVGVLTSVAQHVRPVGEPPPCRDEKDRMYLHCAAAGNAEYLITRDDDLLSIGTIGTCRIVKPEDFLEALRQQGSVL